jgi:SAM-dependent methyltransferase
LKFEGRRIRLLLGSLRRRLHGHNPRRDNSTEKVSAHWDQLASDQFKREMELSAWIGIPQVHLNFNYLLTGSRDVYWAVRLRELYFPNGEAGDVLSLGCGDGHLDRIFKNCGFHFRSVTGIDLSPRAIERAQALAEEMKLAPRISYLATDLNVATLPPSAFDFIYFFQSLHHIEALEHMLGECRRALRPGGVLMVNEFVGPSRFQWDDQQVEMANALINVLPEPLRRDLRTGRVKTTAIRPTTDEMIAGDPSEAVRSADIESVLKEYFQVVGEWNWGGTLNYLVFENIAGNFNPEDPYHKAIIELLIHHENALIRSGILPSNFKVFVARRKGEGKGPGAPAVTAG